MENKRKSFLELLDKLNDNLEFISEDGKYAIVKSKYGLLRCRKDTLLTGAFPKPNSALNRTEYYKNMILEKYPHIFDNLELLSEIKDWKSGIICKDMFGKVRTSAQSLLSGLIPSQKTALDYKEYLRNKLIYIHKDFGYDFEIINSDYSYLICPKHGKIKILNRYLLLGYICPICKSDIGNNVLYLINLKNNSESFYKIGVSRKTVKEILRYKDYRALGFNITPIIELEFNNSGDPKVLELQIKELIKNDLYFSKFWSNNSSTECFIGENLLITVCNHINLYINSCDRITSKTSGCGCSK